MENLDIRIVVSDKHLKYKDIAYFLNISPEYLSRLMKIRLSEKNRKRIMNAVEHLAGGKE